VGGARGFAKGLLRVALLCVAGAVGAQTTETETALTKTVLTEEAQAKRWHLSIQEWDEYKTLMQGPRGIWSPNLDPVTVLGIHAETDADRKRYAELLVTIEFERVEKELLFQRAYDEAAHRLFPNVPPVATVAADQTATPVPGNERIAFVGSIDPNRCPTCRKELALLMKTRTREKATLDLFLADASNDDAIRAWAHEQGVNPEDVSSGRITLNHAPGPLTASDTTRPIKPRVMRRSNGQWSPLDLLK
jgi:integrating conjugative element protein (TIGR03759 family)